MKKIYITGGRGFLGNSIIKGFVEEGHEIMVLSRSESANNSAIKFTKGELSEIESFASSFLDFNPDIVFHLATHYEYNHSLKSVEKMFSTNVTGLANLLELSHTSNVDSVVNFSSCFAAGTEVFPNQESTPVGIYAWNKKCSEDLCKFYFERYGLKTLSLRIFPPYGFYDKPQKVIPSMINAALSNETMSLSGGEQRWDFINAKDISDLCVAIARRSLLWENYHTLDVGTGESFSLREIAHALTELTECGDIFHFGAKDYRANDPTSYLADPKSAYALFGWKPKIKLISDGLIQLIEHKRGSNE